MATNEQRSQDLESLYARLLDTRPTGAADLVAWAKQSYERVRLLIGVAVIEQRMKLLLEKNPSMRPEAPIGEQQKTPLPWLKRLMGAAPSRVSLQHDATVRSLQRMLALVHGYPDPADGCDLYERRDSEYEDLSRFVLSRSCSLALVYGPNGSGKSAYLWEKLKNPQGLMGHMKTQGLRAVSCNGFVLDAKSLTDAGVVREEGIHVSIFSTLERHLRERFIKHFSRRTQVGWVAHVDSVLRSTEEREKLCLVDGTHRLVAAAAVLCLRDKSLDARGRVLRKPPDVAPDADLASDLVDIAAQLCVLGLNDIDDALRHFGVERPDHIFWCGFYASWFRTEQPLLAIDQVEEVPRQSRVQLVQAIIQLSATLAAKAAEGSQQWKVILALRSGTVRDMRAVLWSDMSTCIVLGESARYIPRNVTPLCNPVTPHFMFEAASKRLRCIVEMHKRTAPASSDLVHAADRLEEIFREQWALCVNGSRHERALFASHCASVGIRTVLKTIFMACLYELYTERQAARVAQQRKQARLGAKGPHTGMPRSRAGERERILHSLQRSRSMASHEALGTLLDSIERDAIGTMNSTFSSTPRSTVSRQALPFVRQSARETIQAARAAPPMFFRDTIEQIMSRGPLRDVWRRLNGTTKRIVSTVGTKLEPIVQIPPAASLPTLLGFECLALGPSGESLPELFQKCAALDTGALRICLAIAAVETIDRIGSRSALQLKVMEDLKFSLNLDPTMVDSPLFRQFLLRYATTMRNKVMFTIGSHASMHCLNELRSLQGEFDLRFVADGFNMWSGHARESLIHRVDMTKMDRMTLQRAMRMRGENPVATMRSLRARIVRGRPLIVEGILDKDQLMFLQDHWDAARDGELYRQGGGIQLGDYWDLQSLLRFDCRHVPSGSTVSSQSVCEGSRSGSSDFHRRH